MTEKLIAITIKLDYSKVPSKSTVPTYGNEVFFASLLIILNVASFVVVVVIV